MGQARKVASINDSDSMDSRSLGLWVSVGTSLVTNSSQPCVVTPDN